MIRILFGILLIMVGLSSGVGNCADKQSKQNETAVRVASHVYFAMAKLPTVSAFIASSDLPEHVKKDITANLNGHSLMGAKFPRMSWQEGSTSIGIGSGASRYWLDFQGIEKREVKINGKTISVSNDALFSEVFSKVKGSLKSRDKKSASAIFSLLVNAAYAAGVDDTVDSLVGAVGFVLGMDSLQDCATLGRKGTDTKCVFRDKTDFLSDLNWEHENFSSKLESFACGKNEISYNYVFDNGSMRDRTKIKIKFEDSGKLKNIDYIYPNGVACSYEYDKNRKLTHVTEMMTVFGVNECMTNDLSHDTKLGEKASESRVLGTSIDAVEACCKEAKCVSDVQAAVRKNAASGKKGGSVPSSDGNVNKPAAQ